MINYNSYNWMTDSNIYLCKPNKTPINTINCEERQLNLRFNDLSELTFKIQDNNDNKKIYENINTKMILYVDNIGWFEIVDVKELDDGLIKYKSVRAESYQTIFKHKGFYVEDRVYMIYNPYDPKDENYNPDNDKAIPSVIGQLYQQLGVEVNIGLSEPNKPNRQKNKIWTIDWVDNELHFMAESMANMYVPKIDGNHVSRKLTTKTTYGYDFMLNDVEKAFDVIFDFDYLNQAIKIKTLNNAVKRTDIYLSFDNTITNLEVNEKSDDIVTVLSCSGENIDIRNINPMGTNYIVDFSYYMKMNDKYGNKYPWMTKELINALTEWKNVYNLNVEPYTNKIKELKNKYLILEKNTEILQKLKIKQKDVDNINGEFLSNKIESNHIFTAETIIDNEKSLYLDSMYKNGFSNKAPRDINVFSIAPSNSLQNGKYVFDIPGIVFKKISMGQDINSLLTNLTFEDKENDKKTVDLYFFDNQSLNTTYSRFLLKEEVYVATNGVVKINDVEIKINPDKTLYVGGQKINVDNAGYFNIPNKNMRCQYRHTTNNKDIISYFYINGFDRIAFCENSSELNKKYIAKIDEYNNLDIAINNEINSIKEELKAINNNCEIRKFVKNKDVKLYEELEHYWIEGNYTNNSIKASDNNFESENIELANEIKKSGEKELEKISQPKFSINASLINFLSINEFKKFSKQIELGCTIIVEKDDYIRYSPALMSVDIDMDNPEKLSLSFSNAGNPYEVNMTYADLIKQSNDTSRTVSANWSNLTDYSKNKENLFNIIKNPLDSTLRAMQDDMSEQEFIINDRGILGRRKNENTNEFENEQVRMINNRIIFTDDEWKTAKTALGKISYVENGQEKQGYGLIAEAIIGKLLLGEKAVLENKDGSVNIDGNGITIWSDLPNGTKAITFNVDKNGLIVTDGEKTVFKVDKNGGSFSGNVELGSGSTIPDNFIKAKQIENGSITNEKISNDGISKIADNSITAGKIANGSIDDTKIIASGVSKIADNSVTAGKIVNGSISDSKITANGVSKIADNSVTTNKIANGAVVDAKIKGVGGNKVSGTLSNVDLLQKYMEAEDNKGLTIYNGNIKIYDKDKASTDKELVFYADTTGNLVLKGDVYATNGVFNGEVNASNGVFNGMVNASSGNFKGIIESSSGNIGGFNITKTGLQNTKTGFYLKEDGIHLSETSSLDIGNKIFIGVTDGKGCINTLSTLDLVIKNNYGAGLLFTNNDSVTSQNNMLNIYNPVCNYTFTSGWHDAGGVMGGSSYLKTSKTTFSFDYSLSFPATQNLYVEFNLDTTMYDLNFSSVHNGTPTGARNYTLTASFEIAKGNQKGHVNLVYLENSAQVCQGVKRIYKGSNSSAESISFKVEGKSNSASKTIYVVGGGSFAPNISNSSGTFSGSLGVDGKAWETAILKSPPQITSDKNEKNSVIDLCSEILYDSFFDKIKPVSYKYNKGTSGRTHIGFIAQDIEESLIQTGLDSRDFAGLCYYKNSDTGKKEYTLRYEEFIPLNTYEIQKLKKRVEELETEIKEIKGNKT